MNRNGNNLHILCSFMERVKDVFIAIDRQGYITYISPQVRRYGYTPEEIVNRHIGEFILEEDRERVLADFEHTMLTAEEFPTQFRFRDRSGAVWWIEEYSSVCTDESGAVTGIKGVLRDITDRKMAEEELQQIRVYLENLVQERTAGLVAANERLSREIVERKEQERRLEEIAAALRQSNQELERFAYVASHDLQEPIRAITSYAQLIARRYQGRLDPDADEFLQFIVDGGMRMQALVNDLLEYSRVSTQGKPLEPTESESALRHALDNLNQTIEDQGACITHDPLPRVMADNSQLVRLFQNLIDNAIKFRREDERPEIHISVRPSGTMVQFSVRDNGIGIDPEYRDKIFVMFQRLHTMEQYPGTGIGLAICKRIVERHGGRIWVESEPGKGSVFHFTLPAVTHQR